MYKAAIIIFIILKLDNSFCLDSNDLSSSSSSNSSNFNSGSTSSSSNNLIYDYEEEDNNQIVEKQFSLTKLQKLVLSELIKNLGFNFPLVLMEKIAYLTQEFNDEATKELWRATNFLIGSDEDRLVRVQDAINNYANVNATESNLSIIEQAINLPDSSIVKLLLDSEEHIIAKDEALIKAVYYYHMPRFHCIGSFCRFNSRIELQKMIELLLVKGANPSQIVTINHDNGWTEQLSLLVFAAKNKYMQIVSLLLKHKADPNIKSIFYDKGKKVVGGSFIDMASRNSELQKILDEVAK